MVSRRWLAALALCLLVAACGGSSHPAAGTSSSASSSTGTATGGPTSSATAGQTSSAPSGGAAITTTTSSTSRPPEVPRTKGQKSHRSNPSGGAAESSGVRVGTTLEIRAGGQLSPPSVSVPAGAFIDLTLINHGSAGHSVAFATPRRQTIGLAANGRASAVIPPLRDGTYRILVDGTPRGQLVIGAQGGP
jgi:hypothetical protein